MARRATLHCSIWSDPEFADLSERAQRMYLMLLSQETTSMVGLLPYAPRRWTNRAKDSTARTVQAALTELVDAWFVVIDESTDEVLIRTRVKHDPPAGPKSTAAMWKAWALIESAHLRHVVAKHIPDPVWDTDGITPPSEAQALRHTPFDTPPDTPSGRDSDGVLVCAHAPPPSTVHRPPSSLESSLDSYARPHGEVGELIKFRTVDQEAS